MNNAAFARPEAGQSVIFYDGADLVNGVVQESHPKEYGEYVLVEDDSGCFYYAAPDALIPLPKKVEDSEDQSPFMHAVDTFMGYLFFFTAMLVWFTAASALLNGDFGYTIFGAAMGGVALYLSHKIRKGL